MGPDFDAGALDRLLDVAPHRRKRLSRKPFPDHLPRERVVIPAPANCPCRGSDKLSKLGKDITETRVAIPRRWKVIQTVREKISCRHCEKITQPPAPFRVTPRGFAGPNLSAMILFEKFGQHQPLNRQAGRDTRKATLMPVLEDTGARTFKYLCDFGDGWAHTTKVKHIGPAREELTCPRLLEATGCAARPRIPATHEAIGSSSTPSTTPIMKATRMCATGSTKTTTIPSSWRLTKSR